MLQSKNQQQLLQLQRLPRLVLSGTDIGVFRFDDMAAELPLPPSSTTQPHQKQQLPLGTFSLGELYLQQQQQLKNADDRHLRHLVERFVDSTQPLPRFSFSPPPPMQQQPPPKAAAAAPPPRAATPAIDAATGVGGKAMRFLAAANRIGGSSSSSSKGSGYGAAGKRSAADGQRAKLDFEARLAQLRGETLVFTDGSCSGNPGPGGSGAVVMRSDPQQGMRHVIQQLYKSCGRHSTNNIAELTAIEMVCEWLLNPSQSLQWMTPAPAAAAAEPERLVPHRTETARRIYLFTDSNYCFGLLTKNWSPSANQALVQRVRTLLQRLARERNVAVLVEWVPGHVSIDGNEMADQLANRGAAEARLEPLQQKSS